MNVWIMREACREGDRKAGRQRERERVRRMDVRSAVYTTPNSCYFVLNFATACRLMKGNKHFLLPQLVPTVDTHSSYPQLVPTHQSSRCRTLI